MLLRDPPHTCSYPLETSQSLNQSTMGWGNQLPYFLPACAAFAPEAAFAAQIVSSPFQNLSEPFQGPPFSKGECVEIRNNVTLDQMG